MTVRTAVGAANVLVLFLIFDLASAAAGQLRDRTPPTTPTSLRITSTGATSVSIAWNASADNSSNWWYCVQLSASGCIRVDRPQTTFTHPRLWSGGTYTFSVYAIDAAGNRSANSNSVTYTAPPDVTPPSAPTLSVTGVWRTRVSLSWTASVDNATEVGYTLLVNGSPYSGSLGPGTVLDLSPSTTYLFKVIASDQCGNSAESNTVSVTTPTVTDTVAPSTPTNLRLSPESVVPEIWLDWDQSTDNADAPSQIKYEVYLNGQLDHVTIGRGDTITYCSGTGPNTIVIRAVDTSGNVSAFSNQIAFC
jgi:chitodextrinase